jgi:thioredoxin-dependent peroxiredoxin
LSDPGKKVLKEYAIWAKKKFLGKEFMGIVRSTFIIDEKGKTGKSMVDLIRGGYLKELDRIL